jgi:hypothetical protein
MDNLPSQATANSFSSMLHSDEKINDSYGEGIIEAKNKNITFVTAFYKLYEEEPYEHKTIEWRINNFRVLAKYGIKIVIYSCESTKEHIIKLCEEFPDNLFHGTLLTPYEETEIYKMSMKKKEDGSFLLELPSNRNIQKDTYEYLTLMNCKIEFVRDAILQNHWGSLYFAWMDFSMAYLFSNKEETSKLMANLIYSPFLSVNSTTDCSSPIFCSEEPSSLYTLAMKENTLEKNKKDYKDTLKKSQEQSVGEDQHSVACEGEFIYSEKNVVETQNKSFSKVDANNESLETNCKEIREDQIAVESEDKVKTYQNVCVTVKNEKLTDLAEEQSKPKINLSEQSVDKLFETTCKNFDKNIKNKESLEIKPNNFVVFPGCWSKITPNYYLNIKDNICWRFCGTFFLGNKESILEMYNFYIEHYPRFIKETNKLTWEVNIWAWLEANTLWSPIWYSSDHNDRLITDLLTVFKE